MDIEYCYTGKAFNFVDISVNEYSEEYYNDEINLESTVFYEMRKPNNILSNKLCDSSQEELKTIKAFFKQNKHSFFFCITKGDNRKYFSS